jgi:hypothetical protein
MVHYWRRKLEKNSLDQLEKIYNLIYFLIINDSNNVDILKNVKYESLLDGKYICGINIYLGVDKRWYIIN